MFRKEIHIPADDFVGRKIGERAGIDSFLKVNALRSGETRVEHSSVRYPLNSAQATTLVEFGFEGEASNPLPTRVAANYKEAVASPNSGIYFIHSPSSENDDVEILAKGKPIREISARGLVSDTQSLAISFDIEADSLVNLLTRSDASLEYAESNGLRLRAYEIVEGVDTLIGENRNWKQSDRASLVEIFANRDTRSSELLENDRALPLSLSRGSYKIVLESDNEQRANLRLILVK